MSTHQSSARAHTHTHRCLGWIDAAVWSHVLYLTPSQQPPVPGGQGTFLMGVPRPCPQISSSTTVWQRWQLPRDCQPNLAGLRICRSSHPLLREL